MIFFDTLPLKVWHLPTEFLQPSTCFLLSFVMVESNDSTFPSNPHISESANIVKSTIPFIHFNFKLHRYFLNAN